MTDWDVLPSIPSVRTNVEFNNLAEIIVQAYDMEYGLLQSYSENAKVIFGFYFIKNTVNGLSQLGIPKNFKLD